MKRKGFTLIELLVTILLLGIIGTILIISMTNINKSSKEKNYKKFIENITASAKAYGNLNEDVYADLYATKGFMYITIGDLISAGVLDETIKNPYTDEAVGRDELIKVDLDADGNLSFHYPVDNDDDKKDTFLIALSDTVVYGEPYNCYTGLGTYQLSLSDENGNLLFVNKSDEELNDLIKTYAFKCTYDSRLQEIKDPAYRSEFGIKSDDTRDYYSIESNKNDVNDKDGKAGIYTITYSWITENGTKKTATRNLKVSAKVIPLLKFAAEKTPNKQIEANDNKELVYTPTYDSASGWNRLIYKPAADGLDTSTNYKITANTHNSSGNNHNYNEYTGDKFNVTNKWPSSNNDAVKNVTNGETNDWDATYYADDGKIDYNLQVQVKGHYVEGYNYLATDTITVENKLIIPEDYISTGDETANEKNITINELNKISSVGLSRIEYMLVEDDSQTSLSPSQKGNEFWKESDSELNRGGTSVNSASKILSARVDINECLSQSIRDYKTLFYRAVNKNG